MSDLQEIYHACQQKHVLYTLYTIQLLNYITTKHLSKIGGKLVSKAVTQVMPRVYGVYQIKIVAGFSWHIYQAW